MKAKDGAENIYISQTGLVIDHTVAIYNKFTETLEICEGYAKLLPKILKTLRDFQKAHNMTILPMKVEYW